MFKLGKGFDIVNKEGKKPEKEKPAAKKRTQSPKPKKSSQDKKTAQLMKKLRAAQAENAELKDKLLRTAAELDNFKKRTEKEIAFIIQNANRELILSLLPVVDDLERSLKISHDKTKIEDFHRGIELIYQKLESLLENLGVTPMESVGSPFNVEEHDALMQAEKDGVEPGIVLEEHEKGYYINNMVLRHAKVIVSK